MDAHAKSGGISKDKSKPKKHRRQTFPILNPDRRPGCIEDGDEPLKIKSSCCIQGVVYHMVEFKNPSRTPRLYESKKLMRANKDFLFDYYENLITWVYPIETEQKGEETQKKESAK